ncbi:cytochrome P450 [Chiua virens]|nr:cytochrome P450 [Chiua virens]
MQVHAALLGLLLPVIVIARLAQRKRVSLEAFPIFGSNNWLGSWWDGYKYATNAIEIIQRGYEKHVSVPFRVADLYHWTVVLSDRKHIEEVLRTPAEVLSFPENVEDRWSMSYIMGGDLHGNPYHIGVIRSQLTRHLGTKYLEIRDEIVTAFDEVLDLSGEEWKSVPALISMKQIVCRTTNRLFIGLPLCRDPDYIDLNIQFIVELAKAGTLISLFPKFMKGLATHFLTGVVARDKMRALKHLGPIIKERLQYLNEYGKDWEGKPNDLISWLIEEANGPDLTAEALTLRVLAVNFAAVHTAANGFTHALYYLAANPQYIQPLREEVETIVEHEGWSKAAVDKMRRVDSFMRECQRMEGTTGLGVQRKAMEDFTFLDGTFIPKGTTIGVATRSLDLDNKLYENAHEFQPFRFSTMRSEDGARFKHQYASTAIGYLPFGHGKHACPGRFFAASELKTMLAHVVVTYDVKLEDNTTRPHNMHIGTSILANSRANVLFRKRVD